MPASFPVGFSKVEAGTQPRFTIVSGNEPELEKRIVGAFSSHTANHYTVDASDSVLLQTYAFTQGHRTTRDTFICVQNTDRCREWDWLPKWFNQVKRTKLLLLGSSVSLVSKLTRVANTRGMVIDTTAPKGEAARNKLLKTINGWYGQSPTQLNLLLNKNDWCISPCLQLLDKLALLQLPLTSDTIMRMGVVSHPAEQMFSFLTNDNAAQAMTVIQRMQPADYRVLVNNLSDWIDKLARVKCSQGYMKSVNDIAFETGIDRHDIEQINRTGRKFDLLRINRLSLAVAAADREITRGNYAGVLEVMTSKW